MLVSFNNVAFTSGIPIQRMSARAKLVPTEILKARTPAPVYDCVTIPREIGMLDEKEKEIYLRYLYMQATSRIRQMGLADKAKSLLKGFTEDDLKTRLTPDEEEIAEAIKERLIQLRAKTSAAREADD